MDNFILPTIKNSEVFYGEIIEKEIEEDNPSPLLIHEQSEELEEN